MKIRTTEPEQIKAKIQSFMERYQRRLEETNSVIRGMKYKSWEKEFLACQVIVRTEDMAFFKALFSEELKVSG